MSHHILHYRLKKLKRAFLIWITLISLLIKLWIDNIRFTIFQTKSNEKSRVQIKRARWFTNQLIKLGSAFIKIGQLLSARPDLIPNTWIQELSKLQDQVPNFSFKQVEETILEELGSKFNEIDQIICDPVGSASLAQVHRATLKDGKKVVFKVQRPNLKELFIIDLGIMQQIAGLLQKNKNWSRGRNWVEIAKECRKVLMKELDFNCEAQYAARFRQQFLDDENVEVPEVIWGMSSEKVLCLSYLEGTKISDLEKLQSQEIDLPKIAEIGAISYLKQLVNEIKNEVHIMVLGLTPVNEESMPFAECLWYSNQACSKYENKIEETCLELNVPFLSIHEKMINLLSFKELLSSDGIHLNTKGHKWIYDQISEWPALKNWADLK